MCLQSNLAMRIVSPDTTLPKSWLGYSNNIAWFIQLEEKSTQGRRDGLAKDMGRKAEGLRVK